jgi:hypothetical protein
MSAWHREHPELVGTDADPWMANPTHAAAHRELEKRDRADASARRLGFGSIEAAIEHAEANASTHYCDDCSEFYGGSETPIPASGRCRYCGGELTEREP